MAKGNCRFLYKNLIKTDADTVTVSSVKPGQILGMMKDGTGTASMAISGSYTADNNLEYIIEIDSISGGTAIGQATFRWKTDLDATWVASGVVTSGTAISLSNGVSVHWTGGIFALYDKWYFKAVNRFGSGNFYDYDRDTIYKSNAVSAPITIVIDFGVATSFNSFILLDHNLTSAAVIKIQANATDSWGAPTFTETVTWNTGKILHYTSTTPNLRYARVYIDDPTNTEGYIECSEIFIGSYFEPSRTYRINHSNSFTVATTQDRNRYGVVKKRYHNKLFTFSGSIDYLPSADMTLFETMIDTIGDREAEALIPLYFNMDSLVPNDFYLMEWEGLQRDILHATASEIYYSVALSMSEFARSLD